MAAHHAHRCIRPEHLILNILDERTVAGLVEKVTGINLEEVVDHVQDQHFVMYGSRFAATTVVDVVRYSGVSRRFSA